MIKKYFLSLLITLSISSTFLHAGDFIPDELDILSDTINYAVELTNIASLNSKNHLQIKGTAALSSIKNIARACYDAFELIIAQDIYSSTSANNKFQKRLLDVFSLTMLCSCFINLKFALHDKESFVNSKKIAEANQTKKTILPNQKNKQIVWLTCNTILPYIALAIKRLMWDQKNFRNILHYADNTDLNSNLYYDIKLLIFSRLITNISENLRRSILYKQLNSKLDIPSKNKHITATDTQNADKTDEQFLMPIEGVFSYPGIGTVVTGKIEKGKIKVGEEVFIIGSESSKNAIVHSISTLDKELTECAAGNNVVGILFKDITEESVQRGHLLTKASIAKSSKNFNDEVVHF